MKTGVGIRKPAPNPALLHDSSKAVAGHLPSLSYISSLKKKKKTTSSQDWKGLSVYCIPDQYGWANHSEMKHLYQLLPQLYFAGQFSFTCEEHLCSLICAHQSAQRPVPWGRVLLRSTQSQGSEMLRALPASLPASPPPTQCTRLFFLSIVVPEHMNEPL